VRRCAKDLVHYFVFFDPSHQITVNVHTKIVIGVEEIKAQLIPLVSGLLYISAAGFRANAISLISAGRIGQIL